MKTSEQINEIAEALAAAQGEIQNPSKSAENPFFKSKYADLAEVLRVVRPAFSRHGLSVVQMPYGSDDGGIGVTTMISHKSGQWMQGSLELPLQVAKNVNQDAGSAITYMRRYALAA
ncbi:MAG: ERF family protein, partial [Gammaproteobacteria bacterium]|nr:ERF family protein [Gammaproteobacteria bacterium]